MKYRRHVSIACAITALSACLAACDTVNKPVGSPQTSTPQLHLTATANAFAHEPRLTAYLDISNSPDWDHEEDESRFEGIHQARDVPIQVRTLFPGASDLRYVWMLVENTNPTQGSCGTAISVLGPIWSVSDHVLDPSSDQLPNELVAAYPTAALTPINAGNGVTSFMLEGELVTGSPLRGPIVLIFYPQTTRAGGEICSGGKLALPLAAFRYLQGTSLQPRDYFTTQVGFDGVRVEWIMSVTTSDTTKAERTYTAEPSQLNLWNPSLDPQ